MKFRSAIHSGRTGLRLLPSLLALGLVGTASSQTARAQDATPKKELSEKAHEGISAISKLLDAKDFDGALKQTETLLALTAPNSYEQAYLLQLKVQVLLNKNDLAGALEPGEATLRLSEKYKFFDEKANQQLVQMIGQLYFQEAVSDKSPESQRVKYGKAYQYLRRWLDEVKKPNPALQSDLQYYAASALYNQANFNPEKVDLALMKQCQAECEKGLMLSIKPKEQFYILLMAALQQQGEIAKSAEILELLVRNFPNNKNYWQQLLNTYLVQEEYARAVITIERGQKLGHLNTPKDNYYLVGIYTNTQQYEQAVDLLEKGLRNGSLESDQKNWELLAQSYQLIHKDAKALETLKEAQKLFPKAGNLDLLIGNMYYMTDKYEEALGYLQTAVAKGVEKPGQAYVFTAYLALELKKLEIAQAAAEKALQLDPKSKDAARLKEAVLEAIDERQKLLGTKPAPQAAAPSTL